MKLLGKGVSSNREAVSAKVCWEEAQTAAIGELVRQEGTVNSE